MANQSAAQFQGAKGSVYLYNSAPFGKHPTIQIQTHIDLRGDAAKDFALGLLLRMDAPALRAVRDAADARLAEGGIPMEGKDPEGFVEWFVTKDSDGVTVHGDHLSQEQTAAVGAALRSALTADAEPQKVLDSIIADGVADEYPECPACDGKGYDCMVPYGNGEVPGPPCGNCKGKGYITTEPQVPA